MKFELVTNTIYITVITSLFSESYQGLMQLIKIIFILNNIATFTCTRNSISTDQLCNNDQVNLVIFLGLRHLGYHVITLKRHFN